MARPEPPPIPGPAQLAKDLEGGQVAERPELPDPSQLTRGMPLMLPKTTTTEQFKKFSQIFLGLSLSISPSFNVQLCSQIFLISRYDLKAV